MSVTMVTVSDSLISLARAESMMGWKRFSSSEIRFEILAGMFAMGPRAREGWRATSSVYAGTGVPLGARQPSAARQHDCHGLLLEALLELPRDDHRGNSRLDEGGGRGHLLQS